MEPVTFENYPGSKGGSGVAEKIISMMPPHDVYIEGFVGSGAVYRLKKPATKSILIDADPNVHAAWHWTSKSGGIEPVHANILDWLTDQKIRELNRLHSPALWPVGIVSPRPLLMYLDPPYMGVRNRYAVPFTEMQHSELCKRLQWCEFPTMVSGYDNLIYRAMLKSWRCETFKAMTRGGLRTECVWLNFPPPAVLHDERFVGSNFRERERIKRKAKRWQSRLSAMPAGERQAIAAALVGVDRAVVERAIQSAAAARENPAAASMGSPPPPGPQSTRGPDAPPPAVEAGHTPG